MTCYYNENDRHAAAWLRRLMQSGHITKGIVDERSIIEVTPSDIPSHRAHFFAGIAGWDLALQRAGWPEDIPVWTGSCPCQPFSISGRGKGTSDPRHLWPVWLPLISKCRPPIIFGEQVASPAGRVWLAGVRSDLEALGYAVAAADLCAASVGAPHIRQRLFWVAHTDGGNPSPEGVQRSREHGQFSKDDRTDCGMEQPQKFRDGAMPQSGGVEESEAEGRKRILGGSGPHDDCGVGHPDDAGSQGRIIGGVRAGQRASWSDGMGPWSDYILVPCADGKARRVKPGIEPLAHGIPGRLGRLRAYGNAIVPLLASEFISAFLDALEPHPRARARTSNATPSPARTSSSSARTSSSSDAERTAPP